ncbi:hypothetical protein LINPERPRIM_LOCUS16283 [Linum perenne]
MLSEVVAVHVPPPPSSGRPIKSFAEVALGPILGLEGKCTISMDSSIEVEDLGVAKRLQYLERCLCFRFMDKEPEIVNWKTFRAWMVKNWGLPSDVKILCLGEDLWVLECPSKEAVDRILALNRYLYGSSQIFFDRWTSEAGRSSCFLKQRVEWIVVRGIPLHLRSVDLFRALGESCGGFVDYDDRLCPLNSVRIKIKLTRDLPKILKLRFAEEVFTVKVCRESFVCAGREAVGVPQVTLEHSLARDIERPEASWKIRCLRGKAKAFVEGESSATKSLGVFSDEAQFQKGVDKNLVGLVLEEEEMQTEFLPPERSPELLPPARSPETEVSKNGAMLQLNGSGLGPSGGSEFSQKELLPHGCLGRRTALTGQKLMRLMLDFGLKGEGIKEVQCVREQEKDIKESELASLEEERVENLNILQAVDTVAQVLELQLSGSTEEALISVRKSAVKVLDRRKLSRGKTRTERELAKLGNSLDSVIVSHPRERRAGMDSSVYLAYDA